MPYPTPLRTPASTSAVALENILVPNASLPSPPLYLSDPVQSALFNMVDLLTVLLLLICICTYVRGYRKGIFDVEDGSHHGLRGEMQRTVHMYGGVVRDQAPNPSITISRRQQAGGPWRRGFSCASLRPDVRNVGKPYQCLGEHVVVDGDEDLIQ